MTRSKILSRDLKKAARLSLVVGTILLTSGCATTMVPGTDAGCTAYGEARLEMPRPLGASPLGAWVADLDDRMTGTCR